MPGSVDIANAPSLSGDTSNTGKIIGSVSISPSSLLSGTEKVYAMIAEDDGTTPSGATDIYDNNNGVKAFSVLYDNTVALAATEVIVVAWSTVANDAAALTNCQNFLNEVKAGGTRTGQAFYNVAVITPDIPEITVQYDYENTIKRIVALNSNATTDRFYILTVVE